MFTGWVNCSHFGSELLVKFGVKVTLKNKIQHQKCLETLSACVCGSWGLKRVCKYTNFWAIWNGYTGKYIYLTHLNDTFFSNAHKLRVEREKFLAQCVLSDWLCLWKSKIYGMKTDTPHCFKTRSNYTAVLKSVGSGVESRSHSAQFARSTTLTLSVQNELNMSKFVATFNHFLIWQNNFGVFEISSEVAHNKLFSHRLLWAWVIFIRHHNSSHVC